MRFSFTPEQEEFRSSLRRALEARSPTKEVRRLMATDPGFERDGWKKLNQELGLTAIHIPEAYGGGGFGQADLAIVLEEMGRGLLCAPFLSTVLAANAILNAGTEEQKRALLPAIASGEKTATLAFSEDDGRSDAAGIAMTATQSGSDLAARRRQELRARRSHRRPHRRAGAPAGLAGRGWPVVLHRRPAMRRGWSGGALKTMDETRKLARLTFNSVEARLLGEAGARRRAVRPHPAAGRRLPRQRDGGRRRAAARGRARLHQDAHAVRPRRSPRSRPPRTRRPTCWSTSSWRSRRPTTPPRRSTRATTKCRRSPRSPRPAPPRPICRPAIHAVQMHGGIGFTWDNDTHLWFKRAKSSRGPVRRCQPASRTDDAALEHLREGRP